MISFQKKPDTVIPQLCVQILRKSFSKYQITYFDFFLLIISATFSIFLLIQCRKFIKVTSSIKSAIIFILYILLTVASGLKVVRSVVAISFSSVNITEPIANKTSGPDIIIDKILWLIVRFVLLSTEMSIVTFGVATARLDNAASIKRVLVVTGLISFTYTSVQAVLEFVRPDQRFQNYTLYGHGGSIFTFASSLIFLFIYSSVLLLPRTPVRRRVRLPTKKIFYVYCGILALLYLVQAIGSILFFNNVFVGLCIIDVTTFLYFAFYDVLVYVTFLHKYFHRIRRGLTFKTDLGPVDYGDQSLDGSKSYSSVAVSTNYNYRPQPINSSEPYDYSECEEQNVERSTHFYPDKYVVLDRDTNIVQLMEDFYMLPEGARMEYGGRPTSSTLGSEGGCEETRSTIVSLSYDPEHQDQGSWGLEECGAKHLPLDDVIGVDRQRTDSQGIPAEEQVIGPRYMTHQGTSANLTTQSRGSLASTNYK